MKFFKKNIWTICSWVAVFALVAADAFAQVSGGSLMSTASGKVANVFRNVKTITFILGGFGLVAVAYQAAMGKVNWKWFAGLAVGMALLGAAGAIVEYASGDANVNNVLGTSFSDSGGNNTNGNF